MHGVLRITGVGLLSFLLSCMTLGLFTTTASAGIVGTETVLADQYAEAERTRIATLLERDDVRERLVSHGISPEQARERVAGMSDTEVLELAANLDALPAGGSRLLIAILLVIVIILLI